MTGDVPSILMTHKGALTAEQLSKIIGPSKRSILHMVSDGRIPYVRISGKAYFDPVQIAAWWREKETPAIPSRRRRAA